MQQIIIEGMSCSHCVRAATEALEELGLSNVTVDLESGRADFTPSDAVSRQAIEAAIGDAGFVVKEIR